MPNRLRFFAKSRSTLLASLGVVWVGLFLGGCWSSAREHVVAYVALDAEFSQPVLDEFTATTGAQVMAKFDTEATKTVGLAAALIAEKSRVRCDVFWNNEILHTIRLKKLGLLEPYPSPMAVNYPAEFRASDGSWHGFAARARVLLVNTSKVSEEKRPASILDLVHPEWENQVAIANPVFGTTATHAACLFSIWGPEPARVFFRQLLTNARVMSGNKRVAEAVGSGEVAFGLTDTDDAIAEVERGSPVVVVFPDQRAGEPGALLIPNTIAIMKGAPHPERAKAFVDFVLSNEVEEGLAKSASAQIPLHEKGSQRSRVLPASVPRWMHVDWPGVADAWEGAAEFLNEELSRH